MVLIAQITDTHLLTHPEDEMRGVKTWHSLKKVLSEVKKHQPELLIFTGDLAHHGEQTAYQQLLDLIESTEIPAYWLPGNHDQPTLMEEMLEGKYLKKDKSIVLENWQIILLNSFLDNPEYGEGKISESQLEWLASELAQAQEKAVAIAIHHHVVPSGIDWLDQIGTLNAADFWQIVKQYPQVKTVFCGHMHLELAVQIDGIQCVATPSTCTQVTPLNCKIDESKIQDWQQPGFRLFELQNNGEVSTKVHRIQWFT